MTFLCVSKMKIVSHSRNQFCDYVLMILLTSLIGPTHAADNCISESKIYHDYCAEITFRAT